MYGHQSGCLSVYWLMHVTIFLHSLLNHGFDIALYRTGSECCHQRHLDPDLSPSHKVSSLSTMMNTMMITMATRTLPTVARTMRYSK